MLPSERFWSKVRVTARDACWEWTAGRQAKGYGVFHAGGAAVKKLRGLVAGGATIADVALSFGLSRSAARKAARRSTWAHVA